MKNKRESNNSSILNELIGKLSDVDVHSENMEIVRGIFSGIVKLVDSEGGNTGNLKLINHTINEFGKAFNIFEDYKTIRKVAIFGSARIESTSNCFQMAKRFAREIVKSNFMVITGAGGGIMEAGNEGAEAANSFGLNIKLPFEQDANRIIRDDPKCVKFKYFFSRKLMFIKESDATVLFPGGFGTMDEAFEMLTLIQTGKCRPRPIILIEPEDSFFWEEWLIFIKGKLLKTNMISVNDMNLFSYHRSVKDAVAEICHFYSVYNSFQYFRDETIIFLTRPISNDTIERIRVKFKDIIVDDKIKIVVESNGFEKNNIWASVPFLQFKFIKRDFGRLVEMIRDINKDGGR